MYVFLPGTNNAVLVNAGKEFEIGFNGQNLVTLPCKVTKKDATVTLQKKEVPTKNSIEMNHAHNFILSGRKCSLILALFCALPCV